MTTRTNVEAVPRPIEVGPEMAALERFFRRCTWEGTIHKGGMGPGTPAMKGIGRGTVRIRLEVGSSTGSRGGTPSTKNGVTIDHGEIVLA